MQPKDQPVTKSEMDASLRALEERFEGRLDALEQRLTDRIVEAMRETETKLLQAFYAFAEANNKRLNHLDGNVAIFLNRLGTVESRLLEIEKRLNIPPAA
jgi:hypothetical protein